MTNQKHQYKDLQTYLQAFEAAKRAALAQLPEHQRSAPRYGRTRYDNPLHERKAQ